MPMKQTTPQIKLSLVDTRYEGEHKPTLYDISLSINSGEFISILGPNGAGKTTLLETINGLLPITKGSAHIFGNPLKTHALQIRRKIGYVIQNFELDPDAPFLCKDIVMTGRTGSLGLFTFASKKDWDIVWESLGKVGMIDFAQRPIGKLSGGEFQKILLARALAQQPQILLLDEPFSHLDIAARNHMEILLNQLNEKEKITILMVSHNIENIPVQCKRVLILENGRILQDGTKKTLFQSKQISLLFQKNKEDSQWNF